MTKVAPAEIQHIKQLVDIHDLASPDTKLRRESRVEWSGPCPVCGGDDRFHIRTDIQKWMCSHCTGRENWRDVIAYVMHVRNLEFVPACEWLAGYRLLPTAKAAKTPQPKQKAPHWDTDVWQLRAYEFVNEAAAALGTPSGAAARAYLEQRRLEEHTWHMWVLGYAPISPPWNKEQRRRVGGASITIPYLRHDDDRIMAVRYRRIDPNIDQKDRYINEAGSACVLHGLHLINGTEHTLIITEGELNAISIWQAAHELGIAVVSIGSQSTGEQTLKAVEWLSKKFPYCMVWCDEPSNALKVRAAVKSPHVLPVQSPKPNGMKIDANDMLQRGLLRAFVERKLEHFDSVLQAA